MVLISSCIVVTSDAEARKMSDWSTPAPLQLAGNNLNASDPVVDMNYRGDAVAAWTTYDESSGTLIRSVSAAVFTGGSWDPVTTISLPGTDSMSPEIAMNDSGYAIVVWLSGDNAGSYYLQATSYIDGVWGEVVNVSEPMNVIQQYSIEINGNGNGSLVWLTTNYASTSIMAAIYSDGAWNPGETISSSQYMNFNPAMALNPLNGDAVFVWEQEFAGMRTLAAASWSRGAWGPTHNITDGFAAFNFYRPSVAMDGSGDIVLAASKASGVTSQIIIFEGRASSTSWTPVHEYTDANNMYDPKVKLNSDGSQLAVAWMVDSNTMDYMNATVYTAGGWTPITRISSLSYDAYNLWLDINDAGDVIALWSGVYSEMYYVCASMFSDGAWGAADYIYEGYFDMPRVAIDGRGNAIAIWYTQDPISSENSVYYSMYIPTPMVSITAPGDGSTILTSSVTVEWVGTDADYYLVSINDGQPVNVGLVESYAFTGLEDGDYSVNVTAYNNDGKSSSAYVGFVVDTAAPELTITSPAVGAWYNTTTVNVTWAVSDVSGIANMSVSMDGEPFVDVTSSYKEFTSLAEGAHSVFVRAYDNVGNFVTIGRAFSIDTELPILNITAPDEDALIDSRDIQLVWTGSSVSAIGRYWISIDGGEFVDVGQNTSRMISVPSDGAHTVTLKARDYAGNYNTTAVSFTVDSIAPVVTIVSPADGNYSQERNVTVEWTVSESGSGLDSVEVSIDGDVWISVAENSFALRDLADGSYTVAVRATDVAGNVGMAFVVFTVDNVAPTATISPSGSSVAIGSAVVVEFSEAMNASSVSIVVNGVTGTIAWNGNVATFTPSSALSYNTEYTVTVSGKDLAGNNMTEMTSTFTTVKNECTISGIVKDADGNAVANATVELSNGMNATTDENGRFEFTGVPSGSYTLTITKDGFQTMTQTVSTVAGETTDLATLSIVKTASGSDDNGSTLLILGIVGVAIAAVLAIGFLFYKRKKG